MRKAPAPVKKISSCVRPGVREMRARLLRPVSGVDQARLADIGAAGERDLDPAHGGKRGRGAGGGDKAPFAGEQPPAGLDLVAGEVGHCLRLSLIQ